MILDFLFQGAASGGSKILTPQELWEYLTRGTKSASGVDVSPDRAMRLATVYTCVRVLSESVGQLPLHLLREEGDSKVKAVDHPLFPLLHDAPNEYQTAQEWLEWNVACLALDGNAYSHAPRLRGRVLELMPFPRGTCTPRWKDGEIFYEVRRDGGTELLDASEVFHVKLFPLDSLLGASPIRAAREAIGFSIAAEQHGASLFGNGAQPGGVLESDKSLSKDAAERLRDSWEARHQGAENAYRTAVLEEGLKWKSLAMPSVDAQWLESRKFSRSEIFGIMRVPPHLGGDLDKATFSNIEHQGLDFVVHGLMPYLVRIEQRIKLQLLSPADRKTHFAKFNAAALLRGDMAARSEFYTKMLQNGALSPNEIRSYEDLNPRDGGDVYLTPSNMLIDGKPPAKAEPSKQ